MDLALNSEQSAFRAEVQEFLRETLPDDLRSRQVRTTGTYPSPEISVPWLKKLALRGWAAPLWPREHGGTGWTPIERFIFEYECAHAGAPLVHPMGLRLVGPVVIRFGTPEQKGRLLPGILTGEDYWCQGYSEPNAGSDLTSLSTSAVRDGDHYVVNGSKIWTTHAHHANMIFMLVRTSSEGKPREGISFLVAQMNSPGISVRPIISMSGEHELNQVFFDDVRVPTSNLIGEENGGWVCAQYLLEFERGAGLFSARLRASLKRIQMVVDILANEGRHPLANPLNLTLLSQVAIELDAFEMLELRTLGAFQLGDRLGARSSMLKLRASRMRQAIANLGLMLIGSDAARWRPIEEVDEGNEGASLMETLVPDYLTSRAGTIYGGASEVQLGIIARSLG